MSSYSCSSEKLAKSSQPTLESTLASKPLNRLSSVTPFYKWEAMSFHHILSDLVSDFGKGPKSFFSSELAKSSQPTSESSNIQTTGPIVKCHTILLMGSHDLSPHTFGSGLRYLKGLQKGVKKIFFGLIFCQGRV